MVGGDIVDAALMDRRTMMRDAAPHVCGSKRLCSGWGNLYSVCLTSLERLSSIPWSTRKVSTLILSHPVIDQSCFFVKYLDRRIYT